MFQAIRMDAEHSGLVRCWPSMNVAPFPNRMTVHVSAKVAMAVPYRKATRDQNGEDDEDDCECPQIDGSGQAELKPTLFVLKVFDRHGKVAALGTRSLFVASSIRLRVEVKLAMFATKMKHRG